MQTIAVDIDDVLSFTAADWIDYTNEKWNMNLSVEDYDEDWAKVWGIPYPEALKRRDIVYGSGLVGRLTHNAEAKAVLTKLAKKYRLIVVTSRLKMVKSETQQWLDQHFGGIFDNVTFTGFYEDDRVHGIHMTKADLLKKLSAEYLIDDQPKHCIAAAKDGITALLFGEYKWNKSVNVPSGVTRVSNWSEIARYFDAES